MRSRSDSLTLSLSRGEVEIRLGLSVIASWLEVDLEDVRTILLSTAGAAALGHHAVPTAPVVPGNEDDAVPAAKPSAPADDGSAGLVAALRSKASG